MTKNGHNKPGKQVYNCKNPECSHHNFVEDYTYNAYKPEVREQVLKIAVDCIGTRATGRNFGISKATVTKIKKNERLDLEGKPQLFR